jgi:hypothetical protein
VQGLERQKQLPTKTKTWSDQRGAIVLSDSSGSPLQVPTISELIRGLHPPDLSAKVKTYKQEREEREESIGIRSDQLGQSDEEEDERPVFFSGKIDKAPTATSKYFDQGHLRASPAPAPSLRYSGPTNETDQINTPFQPQDEEIQIYNPHSDISTMTHIGSHHSTIDKAHFTSSSSAALPYSSPLQRKRGNGHEERYGELVRPEVRRADRVEEFSNPVSKLERMASVAVGMKGSSAGHNGAGQKGRDPDGHSMMRNGESYMIRVGS